MPLYFQCAKSTKVRNRTALVCLVTLDALVICMTSHTAAHAPYAAFVQEGPKIPQPISTKIGPEKHGGAYFKNRPWLCHVGQKASLKPTIPSSFTDKAHFPFITLYHKHKSTGKQGLEVVKPVPGFLFLGSVYLMIYIPFGKWKELFCYHEEGHW